MKIAVFCHDSYNSGANLSMYDWVNSNTVDHFYIVIPHSNPEMKKQFINDNVDIINGNFFTITKQMYHTDLKFKIKDTIKKIYMFLCKKSIENRLIKIIKKNKIDCIISNTFAVTIGAEIAVKSGIDHFWHIREFMELDHKIAHYNTKKINMLASKSYAIFISEVIKEYYEKKYAFKDMKVIYDQVIYNPEQAAPYIGINNKLMMAGTLSDNKGQLDAIKAIELLNVKNIDVKLDIYGDGPNKKMLGDYLKKNDIKNVELKGYCDNLIAARSQYNIALVCSKMEALGRVTIEGMYYNNLIIGSNSGCTKYIIKDGYNGLLYKTGDINDLANKILYALNNQDVVTRMKENAKTDAVRKFSKPISEKIINYIKSKGDYDV